MSSTQFIALGGVLLSVALIMHVVNTSKQINKLNEAVEKLSNKK